MAGIRSIGAASAAARHQVLRPGTAPAQPPASALSAAAQEATETLATTRAEAAKGDQVAVRKLAQLQQAQKAGQAVQVRHAAKPAAKNDGDDNAGAKATTAKAAATTARTSNAFGLDAQG